MAGERRGPTWRGEGGQHQGARPYQEDSWSLRTLPDASWLAVVADGMIYAGTRQKPVLALKAGGKGDVTTSHLAWKWDNDGGPDVPTPVTDGKFFYMVADNGVITCIDAKSGEQIYRNRLSVGATIDSSPLLADGKLYITGENAATVVLAAGPKYEELARNELDGTFTMSSLAVSGSQLFIRTSTHLYCIGKPAN